MIRGGVAESILTKFDVICYTTTQGHCYFSGQATYPSAFYAKGGDADVEKGVAVFTADSNSAACAFHKSVLTTRRQSNGQLISSI